MTLLLTPEESAKELRIGRTRMYDLMRRGEVISIKVDGSRRVPYDALVAYIKRLVAEQSDESGEKATVADSGPPEPATTVTDLASPLNDRKSRVHDIRA